MFLTNESKNSLSSENILFWGEVGRIRGKVIWYQDKFRNHFAIRTEIFDFQRNKVILKTNHV